MRIGLIAHHVAPIAPPFAGGVESMTWYLGRWLAAQGHEVVAFAPPRSDIPGVEIEPLELHEPISARARADVSMPAPDFMAAHHAYQQLMVELIADSYELDVLHINSLHYLPVAMCGLLPTPTALTLHTPPTPWLESSLRARPDTPWSLVAVSSVTARLWNDVLDADHIVPNGVDLDAWPQGPGGPRAAWSGRMVPEKAPHLAILAARAAGLALDLAGPIVDGAYWEREVAPLLGPDVRYAGHLDHEQLCELMGSSGVALATPVWEEPFGLSAAEAIATGTPVAAFARGGLPSVIGHNGGELAEPGDVHGLAAAMLRALRLPRAGVRDHAERRLGIDAMGEGYERIYRSLVGESLRVEAAR